MKPPIRTISVIFLAGYISWSLFMIIKYEEFYHGPFKFLMFIVMMLFPFVVYITILLDLYEDYYENARLRK